jgi:hypothetical protein
VVTVASAAILHHAAAQRRADAQADQSEKQQGDNSLHNPSPSQSTLAGTTTGDAQSSHADAASTGCWPAPFEGLSCPGDLPYQREAPPDDLHQLEEQGGGGRTDTVERLPGL